MVKAQLTAIRFLQKQSPYNAGEVAGCPADLAQRYVSSGIAEYFRPPETASNAPDPDQLPTNPAEWEKLLRDCVDYHEKKIANLRVVVVDLETERDQLKARVAELEATIQTAVQTSAKPEDWNAVVASDAPLGPDGEPIDVTKKDDPQKPAGETGAGNLPPSAANEPATGDPMDPKTQRPADAKKPSDKDKDLKAPPVDKMVRGSVREK